MSKVHNFSAGPCVLPKEVLKQASEAVINFDDLDLSLIEISHRSKNIVEVVEKAKNLVRDLLKVPDGYSILFLQGGASLEFAMVPYNLMKQGGSAAYVNTGTWSSKAIKEAKRFGDVKEIASSKEQNFNFIPKDYQVPSDVDYLHLTSNNTIFGTQFKSFPESPVTIVADMSSDIFSRPVDVSKFGLIYAGAQKNMGPAGVTLVIVKDELLGKTGRDIPSMLDYQIHIGKDSMFNTPPVFAIYVSMLMLQWLKQNGGVEWAQERSRKKAELLYNEVDRNPMFTGTAQKEDRSQMNGTFVLKQPNEELNAKFLEMADEARINGIKGHRSVGGFRASMYNALDPESVHVLVEVMQEFENKYA